MARTIVAGGDSFVWGSELSDSLHGGPGGYSRKTFTCLLASDFEYKCVAYPGFGNKQILKQIKNNVDSNTAGVIVSWSWPTRDNKIDSDFEIIELQDFLKQQNIPYLFTCVDNIVVTNNPKIDWDKWYLFPVIPNTGWHPNENPRGFYQWALEHKYELAVKDKHPLENAHSDAAELMKDKFYELVKKTIQ